MTTETIDKSILEKSRDPIYFITNILNVELNNDDITIIKSIHENRYNITAHTIVNTITNAVSCYILWELLFKHDKVIVIAYPKLKTASAMLESIKKRYAQLPEWMQLDKYKWNKRYIHLCNGSRIITSPIGIDTIRGFTINSLYMFDIAFAKHDTMDDFIACVFPTMASGITGKIALHSHPYLTSAFDEIWEHGNFITHGRREYKYHLQEGI